MNRIYLDNGATSWPKPARVYETVERYLREQGAPAGRGSYREAVDVERQVQSARGHVARLLGTSDPQRIVWTANGTDSLNLALHGLLRAGDHVVTSSAEHNSTLRPLRQLEKQGIAVTRLPFTPIGLVDPDALRGAIRANTRLIALVHASNVTGTLIPLRKISQIAADHGVRLLIDAAQSIGHVPLDLQQTPVDLVAASGHKGLLGILGIGFLYIGKGVEAELRPQRQGGTGTHSESEEPPESLPDRFEAGNLNVPGILSVGAGVEYLVERGLEIVRRHEQTLTERLLAGLGQIAGVTVYGPAAGPDRVGVVSFGVGGYDPQEVAAHLDAAFSIQVRAGLHCAPRMHAALGTLEHGGTIRMSVGPFTTPAEIDAAIQAVTEISGA